MLTVAVILIILILIIIFRHYNYWNKKGVTTVNILYCFSNYSQNVIRRYTFGKIFIAIYNKYRGKRYVGFYNFIEPVLLVFDPELIKKILTADFQTFPDHSTQLPADFDKYWYQNIHALTYKRGWHDLRLIMGPFFTNSKIKLMFPLMLKCSNSFVQYIKGNEDLTTPKIKEAIMRYSHDVICCTTLGLTLDSFKHENNHFWLIGKQLSLLGPFNFILYVLFTFCPFLLKLLNLKVIPEKACNEVKAYIQESIQIRNKQNIIRPDLLHFLNKARNEKTALQITDDFITSQAVAMLFAGLDTTSSSLISICYELAKNPSIQEKLNVEIEKKINNEITYNSLQLLCYMDNVILEAIRLHPGSTVIDRISVKPYYIKAERPDEKDLYISENCKVWIPYEAIHLDDTYFSNPKKFNPDRFNTQNINDIHPYTFLPFGSGPRKCIGERLGLSIVKLLLVAILQNFEIVATKPTNIPPYADNLHQVFIGLKRKT